ncbi:MAG: ECF transporter S component [Clostridia bacterium]|nr:ECF transporter S component [Clostridia bacterium]
MSAKKLSFLALFTALNCITTWLLPIPTGLGNVNFADCIAYLAVALFGFYAIFVGSIGGFFADLLTGYAAFAPFTLVVKAVMAFVAWGILSLWKKRKAQPSRLMQTAACLTSFLGGGAMMVVGYFFTNWILTGSAQSALLGGVPFDSVQALVCAVGGTFLAVLFTNSPALSRFFQEKKK